ncbi:MAG: hypothetical protein H6713_08330 [Myxococcales bacterium]|nr:hypothetical protein [Myxococcales bacterium]
MMRRTGNLRGAPALLRRAWTRHAGPLARTLAACAAVATLSCAPPRPRDERPRAPSDTPRRAHRLELPIGELVTEYVLGPASASSSASASASSSESASELERAGQRAAPLEGCEAFLDATPSEGETPWYRVRDDEHDVEVVIAVDPAWEMTTRFIYRTRAWTTAPSPAREYAQLRCHDPALERTIPWKRCTTASGRTELRVLDARVLVPDARRDRPTSCCSLLLRVHRTTSAAQTIWIARVRADAWRAADGDAPCPDE